MALFLTFLGGSPGAIAFEVPEEVLELKVQDKFLFLQPKLDPKALRDEILEEKKKKEEDDKAQAQKEEEDKDKAEDADAPSLEEAQD